MSESDTKARYDNRVQLLTVVFLLGTPLFFIVYSILALLGVFPSVSIVSHQPVISFALSGALLLLGVFSRWAIKQDRQLFSGYLSLYSLPFIAYITLVSGFDSLPAVLWTVLIIVTFTYMGRPASNLYTIVLFVFAIAENFIAGNHVSELLRTLVFVIFIAILSNLITLIIAGIGKAQDEIAAIQRNLAMQRDRTMTLINNLADAIVSVDGAYKISVYNAAFLNLLDTNSNLEGKPIGEIITLQDSDSNPVDVTELLAESPAIKVHDDISMFVEGELVRLEITSSAIRGSYTGNDEADTTSGYMIILRDITKAKSLEEERDEFISVVSHELRTPITVAEGTLSNTSLMLERGDVAAAKLAESVNLAHDQIVFLARMVNDLSTLSRAERGVMADAEDIDVRELIQDMYNEYQPEAAAKSLRFDLDMPGKVGHVLTSRLYFKELLQNFVTNAIKYTKEGSVTITVHQTKSQINFSVKDSGIGISKADQKKIFQKFYRAEDYRTRETSGTGLGLYVAAKLAKIVGTTIELKSRLNYGSTFGITLPLYTPPKTPKS